jgi:hypothetical protein
LANGGILERCRVKVNLKRIFLIFFTPLFSNTCLNGQKDQQTCWKTLAEEDVCKIAGQD